MTEQDRIYLQVLEKIAHIEGITIEKLLNRMWELTEQYIGHQVPFTENPDISGFHPIKESVYLSHAANAETS